VAEGQTGRKGGGGFYRFGASTGTRVPEVIDLTSGQYRPARRPQIEAAAAGEAHGLRALVQWPDRHGRFAWRVLARTLTYAAALVPEVTENPAAIDEAMKLGYNWTRGPFEMIDDLGVDWFRARLDAEGLPVPGFLQAARGRPLYRANHSHLQYLNGEGRYREMTHAPGVIRLNEVTRTTQPLIRNDAASLWDIGKGVACLEFHTKANALQPESMALLHQAVERAERDFAALVIHSDAPHFSVGVNLGFVAAAARDRDWRGLEKMLLDFQTTCQALRAAPVPVVGAPSGMALGGGFEILLHCDAVQAHANTTLGLVETLVGLIPSGGGCKEMLHRWRDGQEEMSGLCAAQSVFRVIATGRMASSPEQARPLRFLLGRDRATMNRDRLLAGARDRALELAAGYTPRRPPRFQALGRDGLEALLDQLKQKGTPHDHVVGARLARVLSGGDRSVGEPLSEDDILALEREAFLHLAGTPATLARIEHMLEHRRPLAN
jgi:3-hydroxyacyl-CoA dehydrogenase